MAGQVWGTDAAGGYMYSDELSDVLRNALQPLARFQQHCDADDFTDKGYNKGDKFHWNIYSDVGTQGGRLDETTKMPETGFTITQGTGTVVEFGNSVPYSGLLDNMSAQPLKQIIQKALKNDASKAFEAEARAQFYATPLTVQPTSGSSATAITLETTGTATSVNNLAMNTTHVKLISDQMKESNIPIYADGNYRCIGRPSTFRGFKDGLEAVHSYVPEGFRMILNGEVGRSYEGIRFFEQTSVASRGWTNSKSDEAYFFGEDTVIEAIVCPPEIRGKIPQDYGRDKGVAWYALEGFALVHTVAAQARILKWASSGF
jgi:hypothetical protein